MEKTKRKSDQNASAQIFAAIAIIEALAFLGYFFSAGSESDRFCCIFAIGLSLAVAVGIASAPASRNAGRSLRCAVPR